MISTIFKRSRTSRFTAFFLGLCLHGVCLLAVGQEAALTTEQQVLKDEALEELGRRCEKDASDIERLSSSDFTATIVKKVLTRRYCSCLAEIMGQAITPELFSTLSRSGAEREGPNLASKCLRIRLEEEWMEICPLVAEKLVLLRDAPNLARGSMEKMCRCGRESIAFLEDEATSLMQMLTLSITKLNTCADSNGIEIGGKPFTGDKLSPALDQLEKSETDLAAASKALVNFGLNGRWSRDCQGISAKNTWIIFDIPKDGPAIMKTYRGGDSGAKLAFGDVIVSVDVLSDDQLRISSRIDYTPGLEDKRLFVLKRIGNQIRIWQASVTKLNKVIDGIKDGVFVATGDEAPLLSHCEKNLAPAR